MKKVNVVFVMTLRSCSHNAKFGLFCKKICRQEAISSTNDFSNYQNFLDCHQTSKMLLRTFGGIQGKKLQKQKIGDNKISKFFASLSVNRAYGKSEFTHLPMLCPLPYYTSPAPPMAWCISIVEISLSLQMYID